MKSAMYCMFGGNLYISLFFGLLLKCLGLKVALKVMVKMHEGFCGNHSQGWSMAQRIELQEFYWLTLMRDSGRYFPECEKCQ